MSERMDEPPIFEVVGEVKNSPALKGVREAAEQEAREMSE